MRDTRIYSALLMVLSIFLCMCVVFFVWNWNQQISTKQAISAKPTIKEAPAKANAASIRDSLQRIYTATVDYLNTQSVATPPNRVGAAADSAMVNRSADFERLKAEIASLLKERGTATDLDLARQKIAELQLKIAQLYNRNQDMEAENRRLTALLSQMASNERPATVAAPQREARPVSALSGKGSSTALTVGELQLQAVYTNAEDDQVTTVAEDAEKLNGSFVVKGNGAQQGNAVVQVVVTQPNGQVLKSNPWESGAFETAEGRKVYSYQFRFDYAKGEARPLRFSLGADRFVQGNYTMQLYYNGQVIGRLTKTLL
jgi:hypothetical protein